MEFTTKSVVVKKFGGYDALSIEKFPLPQLENNVEVKVHYCGMNFADLYTRQGLMFNKNLPFVLGMECSGVITAIDPKETTLKVGDRVVCYDFNGGTYSDTIRIPVSNCYNLPEHVSLEEGASIFVNYLTAYFTILELGNLKKMENVLIFSCAGGVGYAATQLAKTIDGVKVFGVASEGKEEAALKNGVEKIFSYTDLENKLKNNIPEGFDLILTNQSGSSFTFLQNILKPLGRIVLIGANNLIQNEKKLSKINLFKNWWSTKYVTPESLIVNNRVVAGFHLGTLIIGNQSKVIEALNEIYVLLKECKIKPNIHAVMPVEQIVDATKILAERRNIGKVLLSFM